MGFELSSSFKNEQSAECSTDLSLKPFAVALMGIEHYPELIGNE